SRLRGFPHLAQRIGLGFAAPLSDRLRKIGKYHGEPEPNRNQTGEPSRGNRGDEEISEENERGEEAAALNHKHHWIFRYQLWGQLANAIHRSLSQNQRVEQR